MNDTVVNPAPLLYQAAYLAELGVTVEEFARDPDAALIRAGQYDACALIQAGLRPLMPVMVRLRQLMEKQAEADGMPIERVPLPHPIFVGRGVAQATLIA